MHCFEWSLLSSVYEHVSPFFSSVSVLQSCDFPRLDIHFSTSFSADDFFLLCLHRGERDHLSGVPYKGTNPTMRAPPWWPHLSLITPQRTPPNPLHWAATCEWWWHNSVHSTHSLSPLGPKLQHMGHLCVDPHACMLVYALPFFPLCVIR
jgi:hypothetical protein